jgi:hypothetical protein
MNPHDPISSELGPYIEPEEGSALDVIAERLVASRPIPRPALRASIRARYSTESDGPGPRPAHLWRQVAAYAGSGLALLAVAALGLTGGGPLGY